MVLLSRSRAEALAFANSDLLCWLGGWLAARGDDDPSATLLCSAMRCLRAFNADLKDAIPDSVPPKEMP
jgi:hypothetical protein